MRKATIFFDNSQDVVPDTIQVKQALKNTFDFEAKLNESAETTKTQTDKKEIGGDFKLTDSNITQVPSKIWYSYEEGKEKFVENDNDEKPHLSESALVQKHFPPQEDIEATDYQMIRTLTTPETSQYSKKHIL